MPRYSSTIPTWTPTATADTTALANNTHHTIRGGSTTQRGELREVYLGGQATASAPTITVLGRTSTVGTGTLAGAARLALTDIQSTAPASVPVAYSTATTAGPQRSATTGMLLNLGFNAFGGVVRWVNGPDEIISYLGNAADGGELSLNAFTGGTPGALASTIIFEVV